MSSSRVLKIRPRVGLLLVAVSVYSSIVGAPNSASGDSAATGYQVEFGKPKLVGSSNLTHFWFPVGTFELGEGDRSSATSGDTTIVQRIQQAGDGKHCPPKDHPDWPCSALRVSTDRGSSWQVAPARWPGPLLPETPLNSKRATNISNFKSIYELECVNASCTGKIAQWSAATPQGASGVPALKLQKYLPMTVHGVPSDLQLGVDVFPVMLRDGSILLAIYVSPVRSTTMHPAWRVLPHILSEYNLIHVCRAIQRVQHPEPAAKPSRLATQSSSCPARTPSPHPRSGGTPPGSTRYLQ
jgi:hypothetical protein